MRACVRACVGYSNAHATVFDCWPSTLALSKTYAHICEGFRRGSAGDQRHEGGRPICWRELGGACCGKHSRRVLASTLGVQEGGRSTFWRELGRTHGRTHAHTRTRKYTHANTHARATPACVGCQADGQESCESLSPSVTPQSANALPCASTRTATQIHAAVRRLHITHMWVLSPPAPPLLRAVAARAVATTCCRCGGACYRVLSLPGPLLLRVTVKVTTCAGGYSRGPGGYTQPLHTAVTHSR